MTPDRKNIVIVGPAHPLRGGIAAFNERMSHQLISEGHQVTIFTFKYQYPSFLFPGKTQYSTDPAPANLPVRVQLHSLSPLNWLRTASAIAALKPDHVILRFRIPFMAPCLGTVGRILKRKTSARITGLMDNVIPHEKRLGDTQLIRYFCATCDDFMTLSHQVSAELRQFTSMPIRYSPHPIYDQYGAVIDKISAARTLGLDPEKKYLLFFGLVRKYKGLDLLLEAFAKSAARHEYTLLIAGEFYDDPSQYTEIIQRYQLENAVIIHNRFIPDGDVKNYFSISDLIAQTYRTATQSGISQMAFHFEKPMLVTNVGGLGEIIHDGISGLVASPDPDSIADKLDFFCRLPDKSIFTNEIQKEKNRYSWSAFTHVLLGNS